jgi:hypothetical protein
MGGDAEMGRHGEAVMRGLGDTGSGDAGMGRRGERATRGSGDAGMFVGDELLY